MLIQKCAVELFTVEFVNNQEKASFFLQVFQDFHLHQVHAGIPETLTAPQTGEKLHYWLFTDPATFPSSASKTHISGQVQLISL